MNALSKLSQAFVRIFVAFALIPYAHAGSTGSVVLSGSVPVNTSITVAATPAAASLDLTESPNDLPVATIVESSNNALGYTVTLVSSNGGSLKGAGTNNSLPYSAKYNGSTVNLKTSGQAITSVSSSNTVINVTKSLAISYSGKPASQMMAGSYQDTLTFTITSN